MGSFLSPVIAIFFMENMKEEALERAIYKPLIWVGNLNLRNVRDLAPWTEEARLRPPSP
jgi:hypothetical protein